MTERHDLRFQQLHRSGLLRLPNVWDAGSARLVERAGAQAVATSSAAVAWAHAHPDGDVLPKPLLLATTAAVARAVALPVTVDAEGGYSDDPAQVAELVRALIDAGAVGINLEDGNGAPELLCRKIEAARRAADAAGVQLYINARTDVYLRRLARPEQAVDEVLRRAERYRTAGASGLFPAGVSAAADIGAIVRGTALPVNVLARPGLPSAAELAALGVRRFSAGSSIAEAAFGAVHAMAQGFLRDGSLGAPAAWALGYGELNDWMSGR